MRRIVMCLLVLLSASGMSTLISAQAPTPGTVQPTPMPTAPRDGSATKPASGVLRGRVVAADTGAPLRKAQVRIAGTELREGRTVTSDADGGYEFREVPQGRYTMSASKGGFVQLQYGQLRAFEAGKQIDVRDGQTLEKLDFALPRGSVITGRVIDELGEPVMDVQVAAMRYQFIQGRRRLAPVGRQATTNDIGEFRLFGLLPGQYYVSASQGLNVFTIATSGAFPEASDNRSGYAPTYYPGTPRAAEAQPLTLAVGQTLSDVTVALSPVKTARITGTVLNSDGRAVNGGSVMAMVKNDPTGMPISPTMVRPDGTFTLGGLAPGEYTIFAIAGNPIGGTGMEAATVDVNIMGGDISGLQLAAAKPITVRGRVFTDPASMKALPASAINVMTVAADPGVMIVGATMPAKVNEDLSFELSMIPGHVLFRLGGAPGGFAIRSVRLDGEEIVDTGFNFRPGENVDGVEIEVTNQATTIAGAVTDSTGQPVKDYTVVVFSQDRARWSSNSRHIALGRPDQEGRYRTRIPGGSFYVAALDYMEPGEQYDPEFLEQLKDHAVTFSINAAETKPMDLKIVSHP